MSENTNPLKDIDGQLTFYREVKDIIRNRLKGIRDDKPSQRSMFLRLHNRAVPYIDIDSNVLDYEVDLSWFDDLD